MFDSLCRLIKLETDVIGDERLRVYAGYCLNLILGVSEDEIDFLVKELRQAQLHYVIQGYLSIHLSYEKMPELMPATYRARRFSVSVTF
jgi:hypothetical protein